MVDKEYEGTRLDAFLKDRLPDRSRARIQKAIKDANCEINGKAATNPALRLKADQVISLMLADDAPALEPGQDCVDVLWEDGHLAVVNKPAGLTVHPCPSCSGETLAHRLLARFPQLAAQGGERPGIAHRLDKDTSGVMVIALTEADRLKLAEAFESRSISKKYLALVVGKPPDAGECAEPIGRHPSLKTRMAIVPEARGGRGAHTAWRRLWTSPDADFSLLEASIHTGRTHQIRVHLAHCGWPIIGDSVYGSAASAKMAPRQMLHAWQLGLRHPATGEWLEFSAPPPDDFFAAVANNMHPFQRIVVTGNQGCGKSSFCRDLKELQIPVTSADAIVARLYARRGEAAEWIRQHFGEDAMNADGSVCKAALFQILQQRPYMRRELEKVVHALVRADIESFWSGQKAKGVPLAVAEIPLYFESGFYNFMSDAIVVGIACDREARWQRIRASRGWSEEKIHEIESWQWPQEKKMRACNVVIANNGGQDKLAILAKKFYDKIRTDQKDAVREIEGKLRNLCLCGTGKMLSLSSANESEKDHSSQNVAVGSFTPLTAARRIENPASEKDWDNDTD